jgi:Peptide N-acetyl-beta-D-glucosaminyl asparaginase amidase A
MQTSPLLCPSPRAALFAVLAAAIALPLSAQKSASLYPPITTTGTSLEVTADPLVPRPHTKHCEVTLLTNQAFADFSNKNFSYTPPADCPGPWSKVVFTADFSIQPGVQFDRTGQVFFGGVNIYFGTTAEPLHNQTDTWHVERDLTDYSSLFKTPQSGFAILGNIVDPSIGLTSTIFGTFKLEFFQADFGNHAPRTADLVLGLPNNGTATLDATTPGVTETLTLPTNVEAAYLDVFPESQQNEEQWFLCLPDSLENFSGCGNTAFRQVDVSIDGQPAGVAPVYPWIYTGGVDPGLWIPIPGVQTLNFVPYRVDLTPFAGLLSNGQQHTVGVTVFNAFNHFSTTAALLIFEDHGSSHVTGAVTEDTLTDPNPTVVNNASFDSSGNGGGTVTVTSSQRYTIAGYVNTSHGRVSTKVDGNVNFSNVQTVTSTATTFGQGAVQTSTVDQKTTTQDGHVFTSKEINSSYPFTINFLETLETNGDIQQVSTVDQKFQHGQTDSIEGHSVFNSNVSNEVSSADTATFVPTPTGFGLGPNSNQSSQQTYVFKDSRGNCYKRQLKAANNVLDTVTDGAACHQD